MPTLSSLARVCTSERPFFWLLAVLVRSVGCFVVHGRLVSVSILPSFSPSKDIDSHLRVIVVDVDVSRFWAEEETGLVNRV